MTEPQPIRALAPTNLAEALDALQPFLPTDRGVSVSCYQPGSLGGMIYVHISSGGLGPTEIRGSGNVFRGSDVKLSDALFAAEAEHAAKWNEKHGPVAAAEAEFGQYCVRVAA